MLRIAARFTMAVMASALALASATAVFAQEHGGSTAVADAAGGGVATRVIWMFAGVLGGALVLGILYLLKRRVGAFPKNPEWVAPITIMPSSELPGDDDTHEAHVEEHGDAHGGHAPAPAH